MDMRISPMTSQALTGVGQTNLKRPGGVGGVDHGLLQSKHAAVGGAVGAAVGEVVEGLLGHADDVGVDEGRAFARAVLGVLQAAFPFQYRPAGEVVLRELREDRLEVDLAIAERAEAAQVVALEAAGAETAQARKLAAARAREAELARKEAELAASIAADDITDASPPPLSRESGREVYTLGGDAFPSGSASLTAQAQASLRALAGLLGGGGTVHIEGHTDSQGGEAANQALSQRRAEAVMRVLAEAGVDSGRLRATGKGESSPVADNGSAAGRARNRRVEIIIN